MTAKRIPTSKINAGPIRHETLPDDLIARIRWIHGVLVDVDPSSLEGKVENFRRDADPEQEVAIWQHIAMAHLAYLNRYPSLTLDQKREAFAVLLHLSMGLEPRPAEHLDEHAPRELRDVFAGIDQ